MIRKTSFYTPSLKTPISSKFHIEISFLNMDFVEEKIPYKTTKAEF
jgi:hypothetical protein